MTINWNYRSYSEEQFRDSWNNSKSYWEVLRKLGKNVSGGSLKIVKETGKVLGLPDIKYVGNQARYTL